MPDKNSMYNWTLKLPNLKWKLQLYDHRPKEKAACEFCEGKPNIINKYIFVKKLIFPIFQSLQCTQNIEI